MKRIKNFLGIAAGLLFLMAIALACDKEPVDGIIPTTNFEYQNFDCGINFANMQMDTVYMINSEEELANYFTCENSPLIDFSKKTLLVAYGQATANIDSISSELSVQNSVYSLNVNITLGNFAEAPQWYIALITDKINTNNILLNVQTHQLSIDPCQNIESPLTELEWLSQLVQIFEEDANNGFIHPVRIYKCTYDNDKIGFLIEPCFECPDAGYSFSACDGTTLCGGGGFTGEDNCQPLNINYDNMQLIYSLN